MNLNDNVVYRCLRLGSLHQLHPGRSRGLVRHHDRLHRPPPCVESSPSQLPIHALSQEGLSDRSGSIGTLAALASMRNAIMPAQGKADQGNAVEREVESAEPLA